MSDGLGVIFTHKEYFKPRNSLENILYEHLTNSWPYQLTDVAVKQEWEEKLCMQTEDCYEETENMQELKYETGWENKDDIRHTQ